MAGAAGYVAEHRLVIAESIGRPLTETEVVHHIDRDPANNELTNLMLLPSHAEHMALHKRERQAAKREAADRITGNGAAEAGVG